MKRDLGRGHRELDVAGHVLEALLERLLMLGIGDRELLRPGLGLEPMNLGRDIIGQLGDRETPGVVPRPRVPRPARPSRRSGPIPTGLIKPNPVMTTRRSERCMETRISPPWSESAPQSGQQRCGSDVLSPGPIQNRQPSILGDPTSWSFGSDRADSFNGTTEPCRRKQKPYSIDHGKSGLTVGRSRRGRGRGRTGRCLGLGGRGGVSRRAPLSRVPEPGPGRARRATAA